MDLNKKPRTTPWNETNTAFLKENYKTLSYSEIAQSLNLTLEQVLSKRTTLKLKRTPAEQAAINLRTNTGLFVAGVKPWNAGTKGVMKPNKTSFKSGVKPQHVIDKEWYDGAVVVVRDAKTGRCHKKIRINASNWMYLQRYNWEQNFGPIPKGNIIVFKDGDSMNCEPWNLECISRKEKLERGKTNSKKKWEIKRMRKILFGKSSGKRVKKKDMNKPIPNQDIAVKINEKTTIYVKPGADIEAIKKKYGFKN